MNIYEALKSDHRRFESLIDQLLQESKAGNDQWKATLDELRRDLIPHAHAEEAVFYNALRELDQSKSLVAHSYLEHAKAETLIRALGAAKAIDASWTSMVEKLREDLRHHIQEEENKVFASARQVLSDEEADKIGDAFTRLKSEMAKDADSVISSQMDLIANLMPSRFTGSFRKYFDERKNKKSAA